MRQVNDIPDIKSFDYKVDFLEPIRIISLESCCFIVVIYLRRGCQLLYLETNDNHNGVKNNAKG